MICSINESGEESVWWVLGIQQFQATADIFPLGVVVPPANLLIPFHRVYRALGIARCVKKHAQVNVFIVKAFSVFHGLFP